MKIRFHLFSNLPTLFVVVSPWSAPVISVACLWFWQLIWPVTAGGACLGGSPDTVTGNAHIRPGADVVVLVAWHRRLTSPWANLARFHCPPNGCKRIVLSYHAGVPGGGGADGDGERVAGAGEHGRYQRCGRVLCAADIRARRGNARREIDGVWLSAWAGCASSSCYVVACALRLCTVMWVTSLATVFQSFCNLTAVSHVGWVALVCVHCECQPYQHIQESPRFSAGS